MSALYRGGVALLGVLSVIGLSTALFTDGQHPPMFITIIGAVLDLIGIVLAVLAWRGRPAAAIGLSVVRVFYVGGVPGPIMAVAGTFIVLTIVGVVLMLAGMRRPAPVSA